MRFKGKHRVSKQDLKEDKFQETTEKFVAAYYRDRQKFWIGGAVVVAAIIGVILLVQSRGKGVNSQAELRLTEAVGIYSTGNMEQSEQAFKQVVGQFGNDFAGVKAHFYLGNVYYSTQRFAEAKVEFARFLGKGRGNSVLGPAAQLGVANCEEQLGNNEAAASAYDAVYRRYRKSPLAFGAMMAAGRCYRNAGELARAEAVYTELLKGKPTGESGEEVKTQLAYVQALKGKF
jgi:TolA-binding protein